MINDLHPREVSDNDFQKVSWKKNKVQFCGWLDDHQEMINWVVNNLVGKWHSKENFYSSVTGQSAVKTTFWFELEEDVVHFKMVWG